MESRSRANSSLEIVMSQKSELSAALTALRGTAWSLVMMSGMLNIIYLTGSFFMLEIYDRVIPSKSLPTLIGLGIIAAVLYMGQGVLDLIRSRICNRLGDSLDAKLGRRVYDAIIRLPLKLRVTVIASNLFVTWIRFGLFFLAEGHSPFLISRSCRSISPSASCSTSGSAWRASLVWPS
jgi:ABC-type bacteriocin/lantibiotic exporter with double-glycine peptidase domain